MLIHKDDIHKVFCKFCSLLFIVQRDFLLISGSSKFYNIPLGNFIAGRPKAALLFWFLVILDVVCHYFSLKIH